MLLVAGSFVLESGVPPRPAGRQGSHHSWRPSGRRIRAGVLAGARDVADARERIAGDVRDVGELLARRRQQAEYGKRRVRGHIGHVCFGIERPARPVRASGRPEAANRSLGPADRRRREDGPDLEAGRNLQGFSPQLRREVDQVVGRDALMIVRRRFGRKRLGRRRFLARHVRLRDGPLFDRKDRVAGDTIEQVQHGLFAHHRDRFHRLAIGGDVDENRRGGDIHVPDRVMTSWKPSALPVL